ncbi:integral peroxisomal membrane peroxin [Ascodesmis nigricans]|uniref:Integral peroxisomal membrane peroxin n=1 Tax=Ascodesmis nigricans TaxID=341454 RepID=A0A4S2N685_9PEZI|nr:integral peroxisomal membrane peroxin [Ascodesmis nigricans]
MLSSENDPPGAASSASRTLQDRIFSRVLQGMLPSDYPYDEYPTPGKNKRKADRAPFSLATMSTNFNKFNARIGVVFVFQHRVIRMLQWQNPIHTISAMAVYTFVCLDPYVLAVLPVAIVLLFVMVPAFMVRHPPPPSGFAIESYNARGAATAPAAEVTAVQEMSKDFFRNLRDLQNTMGDFTLVHDHIIHTFGPYTNFSDEKLSSFIFIALFFTSIILFVAAHLVPWRFIFLVTGLLAFTSGHPTIQNIIMELVESKVTPQTSIVGSQIDSFAHTDISLSTTAETREVEIFELQRRTSAGEYEPWIFSRTPYEPLSAPRIAGQRPVGTRFFEDVKCPPGWEWLEGKWTMDLGSVVWVQERFVNGVEVEEEGERWVYDYINGHGRGEWRRRRWVRGVKRKYLKRGESM